MNLNVGCGADEWGDVRLDLSRVYHRRLSKLNIRGDAQNLPFRDKVFEKTKAFHILEHLPDWRKAISEWCRVTQKEVQIEIPYAPAIVFRHTLLDILNLRFYYVLILPKRKKEHLWKLSPKVIVRKLEKQGFRSTFETIKVPVFNFLCSGRKSTWRLSKFLTRQLKISVAFRITARSGLDLGGRRGE